MTSLTHPDMAIKWRLKIVMAERNVNNVRLHELTGLHVGTIAKLRNKCPERIDMATLDKLCAALKCSASDLIEIKQEG